MTAENDCALWPRADLDAVTGRTAGWGMASLDMHVGPAPAQLGRPDPVPADVAATPYRFDMPFGMVPDLVVEDLLPDDDRLWVPQSDSVSFRPLLFGVSQGYYVNLLRVRRSGVLSRHRHAGPVHAMVLKGRWRYLEHDWVAAEGGYAFEPPGEVHTLVVDEEVIEMITLFFVTGALVYVDPEGRATGYEDVFTKLEAARIHYESIGLGVEAADRLIR
jgi:2,4'-dihydroxyacetophenone dioxygenase